MHAPIARTALLLLAITLTFSIASHTAEAEGFLPGQRTLLDAHNCYPYGGLWADRIQRALSTGVPLAIENDLAWYSDPKTGEGRAVVAHGGTLNGKEPTLREYFFDQVRPIVEKALKEGNSDLRASEGNWPLVTLNINDLRAGEDRLFSSLWDLLGEYEGWLCTAVKSADPDVVAPLAVKPVLVLTASGKKEMEFFYDKVPAGGKLRLFGSGESGKATNYRRWRNYAWKSVEPTGQRNAGEWKPEKAAKLQALVDDAHANGYWIRFYTLNGHGALANQGWSPEYNFGSLEAAQARWKAAIEAGVDFIASDQYEDLAKVIHASR